MKCSFCGKKIPEGRGKMFVKNSGQIFYFCNSKCERNWNLGREGKKTRWTETFRKLKEKEEKK
jgi:large subunit ribosomal protein L24e